MQTFKFKIFYIGRRRAEVRLIEAAFVGLAWQELGERLRVAEDYLNLVARKVELLKP